MLQPLISIIVPAYKSEYLKECMDSIVNQSYDNWQLVIVNDHSPYDLDSIIGQYKDRRIVYRKRAEGFGGSRLVDNWNDCLKDVTGDFVINMGDDDVLLPGCLKEYVRLIEKYPEVDVFHGWTDIIDEKSCIKEMCPQHPEHESVYGFMQRIMNGEPLFIGDVLIRTERLALIGRYQQFPLAWHSDHITAYAAAREHGVASTNIPVFGYRKHSRTISLSKDNIQTKLKADSMAFDWYAEFLSGEKSTHTDQAICKCMLDTLPHLFEKKVCQDISTGCRHQPWKTLAYWPFMLRHKLGAKALLRAAAYAL